MCEKLINRLRLPRLFETMLLYLVLAPRLLECMFY